MFNPIFFFKKGRCTTPDDNMKNCKKMLCKLRSTGGSQGRRGRPRRDGLQSGSDEAKRKDAEALRKKAKKTEPVDADSRDTGDDGDDRECDGREGGGDSDGDSDGGGDSDGDSDGGGDSDGDSDCRDGDSDCRDEEEINFGVFFKVVAETRDLVLGEWESRLAALDTEQNERLIANSTL